MGVRGKKVLGNGKIRKNRILRDSRDLDADSYSNDDGDAESVLGVAVSCLVRELQVKQDLGFFWEVLFKVGQKDGFIRRFTTGCVANLMLSTDLMFF